MKKLFTLLTASCFSVGMSAQVSFTDDFESYTAGDYIAESSDDWTTWTNAPGGVDDVLIVDDEASSGTNSLYFTSTSADGGPQDLILPFGVAYNTGLFTYSMNMLIPSGKNGYFNLQGTTTPGTTWTIEVNAADGMLVITEEIGATNLISAVYPAGEWFNVKVVANLSLNSWELLINDVSQGFFTNAFNQVAAADIFPIDASAEFWVDDVTYTYNDFLVSSLNAEVLNISSVNGLAGVANNPVVSVRNNGETAITQFDVEIVAGSTTISEEITGVSLATGEIYEVEFTEALILAAGDQDITATVSYVNNITMDDVPADDSYTLNMNIAAPATGKMVVAEEGTGTFHAGSPRGIVTMEYLEQTYDEYFVGIAVHNNDPMTFNNYNGPLGVTNFPGGKVDRTPTTDVLEFEQTFFERIQIAPKANISLGAQYDEETRVLDVVMNAEFIENASGDYRMAIVLKEDAVTGTSGYAQANMYAGGALGEMGGFETLANPVPAEEMIYNNVARLIAPSFEGDGEALPENMVAGQTYCMNFQFNLPAAWEADQLSLVGLLMDESGTIDNAGDATMSEAIDNGWAECGTVGISKLPEPDALISVYPNPTKEQSFIKIQLDEAEEVTVKITSLTGKLVEERAYGTINGAHILPVKTADYAAGIYFIQIRVGDAQKVEKLIVE